MSYLFGDDLATKDEYMNEQEREDFAPEYDSDDWSQDPWNNGDIPEEPWWYTARDIEYDSI